MLSKTNIRSILLTFIGVLITAVGISLFLTPNKIVCGGVSGMAIILYHSFSIPTGASIAVLNVILLLFGLKILGREFIIKTIIGAGVLSVFVQLLSYVPPLTDDILIASVFGGFLYGFGISIALASGSSTGGTDILGRIIQHGLPHIPIGKVLMLVDGIVILTSLIAFRQVDLVFYGIAALVIETVSIDWLIRVLNISKVAYVITDNGLEITNKLVTTSPRGVTMLKAIGGYTMTEKDVLLCALKSSEIAEFEKKIKAIDKDAFVVFTEAQQIVGNGFRVYR